MIPKLEETIYIDFITSSATGAAADADAVPTVEVFEDATDTAIVTPTATKRTGKAGNYRIPVACTAANGFEAGKSYNVIVSATIGGVAAKEVVARFQVRLRSLDDLSIYAGGDTSGVGTLLTRLTATRATNLDYLDVAVSSRNTGNVTVGSYASGQSPEVFVWGATAATYNSAGTMGAKLNAAGGAADPWAIAVPGAYGAGTAGNILGNIYSGLMAYTIPTSPTTGTVGEAFRYADIRLDATISSRNTGNVTVGGYASGQSPADSTWGALTASYNAASTFGAFVQAITAGTDPWATAVPGAYATGSAGRILGNLLTDMLAKALPGTATAGTIGEALKLADTNLNATISSRMASGNVTVGGYAASQDPATSVWTAAQSNYSGSTTLMGGKLLALKDDVWEATASSHTTSTTMGGKLNTASAAGDPWAIAVPGSYATGTAGKILGNLNADFLALAVPASPTAGTVGEALKFADTRLDAAITSRQPSGNVTVGAYASNQDPATLVLGATASSWNTALTIGNKINAAASAGDPWTTAVPGAYGAGTAGNILGNIYSGLMSYTIPTSPTAGTVGEALRYVDTRLDATITSRQPSGNVTIAGYAASQDPATLVLGATATTWNSAGTIGNKINSAASAGDPLSNAVPGSYGAGTAGNVLGNLLTDMLAKALPVTPTASTIGEALKFADTRIDATVSSRNTGNVTIGGYAAGQDPGQLVWAKAVNTGFSTNQAGWMTNLIYTAINKMSFDASNNLNVDVNAYATGMSPETIVWNAPIATHINTSQFGGLVNLIYDNTSAAGSDPWAADLTTYGAGTAGAAVKATNTTVARFGFDASNRVNAAVAAYATGQDPTTLVWGATASSNNTAGTMGRLLNSPTVAGYASGQSPAALVWGATASGFNGAGTMGQLQNSPIVAGYASGQSPSALVWGVAASGFNAAGTFGEKLNGLAVAGDPWAATLGGYTSTQAGAILNQIGGRIDGPISGVVASIMAYAVETGVSYLQAIRAIAASAAGEVDRDGTTLQFSVMPIGNPTAPARMLGTTDSSFLTRNNIILDLV